MDYCRIDFYDGKYIYVKNDTLDVFGEYRAKYLLKRNQPVQYQRIKRIQTLPPGKKVNKFYFKST